MIYETTRRSVRGGSLTLLNRSIGTKSALNYQQVHLAMGSPVARVDRPLDGQLKHHVTERIGIKSGGNSQPVSSY